MPRSPSPGRDRKRARREDSRDRDRDRDREHKRERREDQEDGRARRHLDDRRDDRRGRERRRYAPGFLHSCNCLSSSSSSRVLPACWPPTHVSGPRYTEAVSRAQGRLVKQDQRVLLAVEHPALCWVPAGLAAGSGRTGGGNAAADLDRGTEEPGVCRSSTCSHAPAAPAQPVRHKPSAGSDRQQLQRLLKGPKVSSQAWSMHVVSATASACETRKQ
jgi:hypothetical protein